jgi:tetratricopeptide (TPR) repeat protein
VQDYSLGDVARILKVSPRRLRYWQKTQLVDSLASDELQDGYAFRDLVCLRTIVSLLEKGVPLQRIRRSLEAVRDRQPDFDDPVAALQLLDEASDQLVLRWEGRLEEAGGQLLLEFDSGESRGADEVTSLADASRSGFGAAGDAGADADRSLEFFERGCELDSDPALWEAAIAAYERAIEFAPDYADAYCNLGAVRYNKGQRDEARRAFESCLAIEEDHIEANFNLANVLEEEGEDERALIHYGRALTADPLYPDLHINLALLYEKMGRQRSASEHWSRYLQFDPRGSWAEVARLRLERNASGPSPIGERSKG